MLELLEQIFRRVRVYIRSEQFDRNKVYARTPEHTTMQFDRDAEDIIIQALIESGLGFEIVSEERPPTTTTATPAYRIIIDPVDGSSNIIRGIKTAGVALAVLPIDAPIRPELVQWALVGELFSGTIYQAQHAQGAFCNGKRCRVSDVKQLKGCIAGVNFDGRNTATLHTFLEAAPTAMIRRTGSSAIDSVYIASGAYDLYLDAGTVLTAESFLPSACIVLEAGGRVSDTQGQPLAPITSLAQGFSLLMAGTKELHTEVITKIKRSAET